MAISIDLRKRIVEAYEYEGSSLNSLSKRFKVGFGTVWRLINRYQETGEIKASSPPGRKSKITPRGLKLLSKLIKRDKSITLTELKDKLLFHEEIEVSLMAIHRACERLGLRYKKNRLSS